jgi:hypothetical protein
MHAIGRPYQEVTVRPILLILSLLFLLTLAAEARGRVYLNNGEEMDALSVWQEGEIVYVLKNRDILLQFDKDEVDLTRTHPRHVRPKHHSTPVQPDNSSELPSWERPNQESDSSAQPSTKEEPSPPTQETPAAAKQQP